MIGLKQIAGIIKELNDGLRNGNYFETAASILESTEYEKNEIMIVFDTFAMNKRIELEEKFAGKCVESLELKPVFRKAYIMEAVEEVLKLPESVFTNENRLRGIAFHKSGVEF